MTSAYSNPRLEKLVSSNSVAAKILELRPRKGGETLVEAVERALPGISRLSVVEAMKQLDALRAGRFVVGRRKKPSRFVWAVGLEAPNFDPRVQKRSDHEVKSAAIPRMLEHEFHVRPGVVARFILPADLNRVEAERLSQLLQAIPFNQ